MKYQEPQELIDRAKSLVTNAVDDELVMRQIMRILELLGETIKDRDAELLRTQEAAESRASVQRYLLSVERVKIEELKASYYDGLESIHSVIRSLVPQDDHDQASKPDWLPD